MRWRQASSPTSDATRRRRQRRRRAWRPSSSLQSEAEGRGDATKRGSFSRGGERGECCKDERDARWRFCLEDDRVSLPRHPPSRPPDLPPSRPPVRLIYRLCRARSERSSVVSLCLSSALHTISKADRAGQNPFASVSVCEEGEGWRAAAAAAWQPWYSLKGLVPRGNATDRGPRASSIMAPFHSSPAGESVARRVVGDRTGRPRCVSLATRPPSPADLRLRLVWRRGNEQNDPFVCLARLYLVTFKHLVLPAITSNRTSLATFFTPTPVHPLTPQAPSSAFPRFPLSTGLGRRA